MGHGSDPRGGGRWSHVLPVQGSGKGRAKAFPWAGGSWGHPWEQRTEGWAGSPRRHGTDGLSREGGGTRLWPPGSHQVGVAHGRQRIPQGHGNSPQLCHRRVAEMAPGLPQRRMALALQGFWAKPQMWGDRQPLLLSPRWHMQHQAPASPGEAGGNGRCSGVFPEKAVQPVVRGQWPVRARPPLLIQDPGKYLLGRVMARAGQPAVPSPVGSSQHHLLHLWCRGSSAVASRGTMRNEAVLNLLSSS